MKKTIAISIFCGMMVSGAAFADVKALLDAGATLKGDVLTVAKPIRMEIGGDEVRSGSVVLKDGQKFEFEFPSEREYFDPMEILMGTLRLRPAIVGKLAAAKLPQMKTRDAAVKSPASPAGKAMPEMKSKGQEAPKAEKAEPMSTAEYLAKLGAKSASKAEGKVSDGTGKDSATLEMIPVNDKDWVKLRTPRPSQIRHKGSESDPWDWRDLTYGARWSDSDYAWILERESDVWVLLDGNFISKADYVKTGSKKVYHPVVEPGKKEKVKVMIGTFRPYQAGKDVSNARNFDVSKIADKAYLETFGRVAPTDQGAGFCVIIDGLPVKFAGVVPDGVNQLHFPRKKYMAGNQMEEVLMDQDSFTIWLKSGATADVNGQGAAQPAKFDASSISVFKKYGDVWKIDGSKGRGVKFMPHQPVTFKVPSWVAKIDITSTQSAFAGQTVTLQMGQEVSIWGRKSIKL